MGSVKTHKKPTSTLPGTRTQSVMLLVFLSSGICHAQVYERNQLNAAYSLYMNSICLTKETAVKNHRLWFKHRIVWFQLHHFIVV